MTEPSTGRGSIKQFWKGSYVALRSPEITMDDAPLAEAPGLAAPTQPLIDRPFDPWRAPRNDTVRIIVADVTGQLGSRERHCGLRMRQRKPAASGSRPWTMPRDDPSHPVRPCGRDTPARRRRCGAWAGAVAGGDEHAVQRPGVRQRPSHPIPRTLDPCSLRGSL